MQVKRLLISSILYLNIALCLCQTIELEGDDGGTLELELGGGRTLELEPEDGGRSLELEPTGGDAAAEAFQTEHVKVLEETAFDKVTVDEEIEIDEEIDITETVHEEEEIVEEIGKTTVHDEVTVEKKPTKVVNEETIVVKKKPEIVDHKVISNGGANEEFSGKEIVEKADNVEKREFFEDDGIIVRQSRMDWGKDIFKIYGNDREDEIEEVTSLEDEDRFGDGTLAQLLDEFLLDPLDGILELLKQTLRSVVANLDHILEQVFKVLAALLNVVLVLVLDILILVIHILADLVPGVFGKSFNKYDGYVTECVEKVKMDPITTSLIELEQCVTDPLFHIVENVIVILTDVQEILGEIDQGLRQLEVVRKAEEALTDIVAIVLDVVERVLEIVEDLVEGPVADILVILPVLLACILGDIGKNLVGGLLNLLKKYVACTTYTDLFDFDSISRAFVFWE